VTVSLPDIPLEIIYRDDVMVAINKPSGLLVHRTALDRHETEFAVQRLRDQIGRRVWPVHRLDRGTSGVLVFALDAVSAHALADQFAHHTPDKRYLVLVRGHPSEAGVIDHPLRRVIDAIDPRAAREGAEPVEVQPALTRYPPAGDGRTAGQGRSLPEQPLCAGRSAAADRPHAPDPSPHEPHRASGDRRFDPRQGRAQPLFCVRLGREPVDARLYTYAVAASGQR
jgi:hypothetical protein